MKTTIVPAQITTVEDRIAGNLTFNQILLLIAGLLLATGVYLFVGPHLKLTVGKFGLMVVPMLICGLLSLRINGQVVIDWLTVFLLFSFRPRRYVFTKSDLVYRELVTQQKVEKPKARIPAVKKPAAFPTPLVPQADLTELLTNPNLTISFEFAKKGGVDVSLKPVKR